MADDRSEKLLKNKTFWIRTLSGFIMSCILIAIFVIGYDVMFVALLLLSIFAMFEFNRALKLGWSAINFVGYSAIIAHYMFLRFVVASADNRKAEDAAAIDLGSAFLEKVDSIYIILIYAMALIVMLAFFVFTFPRYSALQVFGSFFGVFYTGVPISFLYLLRIFPPSGAYLVWLAVFSSWGCDIFAYLFGMTLGKHQLVPKLSPNKSVEGAIGGIAGAVCLGVAYGFIVQKYVPDIRNAPLIFGVFCFFGALVSQIGDMAASAIKRKLEIKDYGKILPGHGGILDRFDSMIIVAPITYLISIYAMLFKS
ncbi:MAG: phosphatidate cytidylyltransferase [Lachnospiraceae bacterium]|jgi:phosphatidate cytidylyltransferase